LIVVFVASTLVVCGLVAYSFTVDGSDPLDVTVMHRLSVDPGLRFVAVNRAVLAVASFDRATVPAVQLLVGVDVVAEKAEYEAVETTTPDATRAAGTAIQAARRAARGVTRDMVVLQRGS
jgi:hypothetical protein